MLQLALSLSDFMNRQGQSFQETKYSASIIILVACNNT